MSDAGVEEGKSSVPAAAGEKPSGGTPEETAKEPAKPAAKDAASGGKEPPKPEAKKAKPRGIDVVYVADIDLMMPGFLRMRARPGEDAEINWQFENVNFVLNVVDVLSGDDQYVNIRKRKPKHSTLRIVEVNTQEARDEEYTRRREYEREFDKAVKEIEDENQKEIKKFEEALEELKTKQRQEGQAGIRFSDLQSRAQKLAEVQERLKRRLNVKREQLQRQRDEDIADVRRKVDLQIAGIKNYYKFLAVALPPIPPLLVGLIVFVRRRLREREGVAKSRLR